MTTLPWESPVSTAEAMQPDTPIPAVTPTPLPAVATNRATGQQIALDFAPQLQVAIDSAISSAVAAHPVLCTAVRAAVRDRERSDRSIMQNSLIDVLVAVLAALFTIISPESQAVGVLWLAAAVLASRTLIQAALVRFAPEGAVT